MQSEKLRKYFKPHGDRAHQCKLCRDGLNICLSAHIKQNPTMYSEHIRAVLLRFCNLLKNKLKVYGCHTYASLSNCYKCYICHIFTPFLARIGKVGKAVGKKGNFIGEKSAELYSPNYHKLFSTSENIRFPFISNTL